MFGEGYKPQKEFSLKTSRYYYDILFKENLIKPQYDLLDLLETNKNIIFNTSVRNSGSTTLLLLYAAQKAIMNKGTTIFFISQNNWLLQDFLKIFNVINYFTIHNKNTIITRNNHSTISFNKSHPKGYYNNTTIIDGNNSYLHRILDNPNCHNPQNQIIVNTDEKYLL